MGYARYTVVSIPIWSCLKFRSGMHRTYINFFFFPAIVRIKTSSTSLRTYVTSVTISWDACARMHPA